MHNQTHTAVILLSRIPINLHLLVQWSMYLPRNSTSTNSNRHHLERDGVRIHLVINLQCRTTPIDLIKGESIRPRRSTRTRHRPCRNFTPQLNQAKLVDLIRVTERHWLDLRVPVRHGRELRAGRTVVLERAVGQEVESRRSNGVLVRGIEVHEGIAGVIGIGILVEIDAVVGSQASVFGDEIEG